ncbi:MAG TPA: mechanosensitive ion channel family protein [Vicinamibacteria bacterium]
MNWESLLTHEQLFGVIRAVVTLILGFAAAQILRSAIGPVLDRRTSAQHAMLGRKVSYYLVLALAFVSALRELGLNLSVLLGAAGVVSVAMGFAAQTSASNLISGLFLMSEGPFVVGEVIQVAETTGEVLSIDLLSVKLRTFDNLYVRVPNETLVKAQITNLSRHPIRRYDMQVSVGYDAKLAKVREVLMGVAEKNPLALREPGPVLIFQSFGESAVNVQFSVWTARDNYLELRNALAEDVKEAFEREGIEIPSLHRAIVARTVKALA